jgi:23S rRNA pseudouridine1911/1915/1917 synthase
MGLGEAAGMGETADGIAVIFEDEQLIGLVKPAGLPTANAPHGVETVYTWLRRRPGQGAFVGIVSRLDAPVSGVLVVAKTPAAAADLAGQFRDRTVGKEYAAVVEGRFPAALGRWVDWHDAIARRGDERRSTIRRSGRMDDQEDDAEEDAATAGEDRGRAAHVRARVVRRAGEVSLVELEPSTGRRHQLRLQLASRGCPIVGDRSYGARLPHPAGIALHARRLRLAHPQTGAAMLLEADWPACWRGRFPALFRPGQDS